MLNFEDESSGVESSKRLKRWGFCRGRIGEVFFCGKGIETSRKEE